MTGILIELRRGPGRWAAAVLLGFGLLFALANLPTLTIWTYATGAVAGVLVALGPMVAGLGVLAGRRAHQHGVADRERLSARGMVRAATAEIGALIAWTMVGAVLLTAVLFGITATKATWGGPQWPWLIAAAFGLAAHAPIGWVIGRLIPLGWFVPLVATAMTTPVITVVGGGLIYGLWSSEAFLVPIQLQAPYFDVGPVPLLGQIAWYLGWSAAAGTVLALVTQAPWRSAAVLGTATVVSLGSGVAVAASWTPRLIDPGRRIVWDCVGEAPEVCVHPAYAASIPELRLRAEAVAGRLAGTPFAIDRVEQRPRGPRQGAPSPGAVAFGFDPPLPSQYDSAEFTFGLDPPPPSHYDRAATEMASGALGIAAACSGADADSRPGRESLTMISTWAADGPGSSYLRADQARAWLWLTGQPVAQVQVWITAHAQAIRDCALSLADFR